MMASLGGVTLWSVLALATPARTYHFAPVLAAATWPATVRALHGRARWFPGLRAAASGLLIAVVATLALDGLGVLAGPSLAGSSALVESAVGAVLGAVWGLHLVTRARPGLLASGRAEPDQAPTAKENTAT